MQSYLWTEVDNPVELHNQAGLALLETKEWVFQARARSQIGPRETTGLSGTHVTLQLTSVFVLCRFLWKSRGYKG